jgi:hypothetical protein
MTPAVDERERHLNELIVRPGNNFWTRPRTGKHAERPDLEAPVVHGSAQNNGAAGPVSDREIEAILVEIRAAWKTHRQLLAGTGSACDRHDYAIVRFDHIAYVESDEFTAA